MTTLSSRYVYWHRNLPPMDAEMIGEHVLEATSGRLAGTADRGTELWDRAYHELMTNTETRLRQEIDRLGGDFAHVLQESIDSRRDDAVGETWLHGCFTYALYRRLTPAVHRPQGGRSERSRT